MFVNESVHKSNTLVDRQRWGAEGDVSRRGARDIRVGEWDAERGGACPPLWCPPRTICKRACRRAKGAKCLSASRNVIMGGLDANNGFSKGQRDPVARGACPRGPRRIDAQRNHRRPRVPRRPCLSGNPPSYAHANTTGESSEYRVMNDADKRTKRLPPSRGSPIPAPPPFLLAARPLSPVIR